LASRKIPSSSRDEGSRGQKRKWPRRLAILAIVGLSLPLWGPPAIRWGTECLTTALSNYRVCSIRVLGTRHLDKDEIANLSGIAEGTPLFEVNLKSACERICSHPWIRSAIAVRRLPNTIELRITEHEPVALINMRTVWAVTSDGVLLPMRPSKRGWDLPFLRAGDLPSASGNRLRDTLACALLAQSVALRRSAPRVWKNLSELFWKNGEMWGVLQKENIEIRLGNGVQEIGWKSLEKLLIQLEATQRLADVESIDLRFNGRIIVRHDQHAQSDGT